jgi:chromosome segregation ATPase
MRHNREPIGNTCGQIDKYIKSINAATYDVNYLKKDLNREDLVEFAIEMSEELTRCEDYLEDLRSSNSTLRDWGCNEARIVDELKQTVDVLEQTKTDLENLEAKYSELEQKYSDILMELQDVKYELKGCRKDLEWYEDKHK